MTERKKPLIIFLHVPRTSGKLLKTYLTEEFQDDFVATVHNDTQIVKRQEKYDFNQSKLYFILREPVTRTISEIVYYSSHIARVHWVNHLPKEIIKSSNVDFTDPIQYVSFENNRNLYCKFLLLREDFSREITENDYQSVLELFKQRKVVYDYFGMALTNLEYCLGRVLEMNRQANLERLKPAEEEHQYLYKKSLLGDATLIDLIKSKNQWDLQLFELLKKDEVNDQSTFRCTTTRYAES